MYFVSCWNHVRSSLKQHSTRTVMSIAPPALGSDGEPWKDLAGPQLRIVTLWPALRWVQGHQWSQHSC
ncbi:unnamed protein product [Urochloa humidicola]